MKWKCLIVDDEPLAHNVIENYIQQLPYLEKAGQCYDAASALAFLHTHHVDILFLDIQLPDLTGLDLLQSLTHKPAVILTTAYTDYALESYEFGVVDYLLKPIRFPRFAKAVSRALDLLKPTARQETPAPVAPLDSFITIKDDKVLHKVNVNDITHIRAWGNYLKVYFAKEMLMTRLTLQELAQKLPPAFLRVHKSYIVNVACIQQLEGNELVLHSARIPVGETYRAKVLDHLK